MTGHGAAWDRDTGGVPAGLLPGEMLQDLRDAGEQWPWMVLDVSGELLQCYDEGAGPGGLTQALGLLRAALRSDRLTPELVGQFSQDLALALVEQARQHELGDPELTACLTEATERLTVARGLAREPDHRRALDGELGTQLYWLHSFGAGADPRSTLDRSIEQLRQAVRCPDPDAEHLWTLANAYEDRFVAGHVDKDRLRAIRVADALLARGDQAPDRVAEVRSLRGRLMVDHAATPADREQTRADLVHARETLGVEEYGGLAATEELARVIIGRGVRDEHESALAISCLQDLLAGQPDETEIGMTEDREDLALMLAVAVGNRIWMSQRWEDGYEPVAGLLRQAGERPGSSAEVVMLTAVLFALRATTSFIGSPRQKAVRLTRDGIRQLEAALSRPDVAAEYAEALHGLSAALWGLLLTPDDWSMTRPISASLGGGPTWLDEPETREVARHLLHHLSRLDEKSQPFPFSMWVALQMIAEPSWNPDESVLARLLEPQAVTHEFYAVNGLDAIGGALLVDRGTALGRPDLVRAGIRMLEETRSTTLPGMPILPHIDTSLASGREALARLGDDAAPPAGAPVHGVTLMSRAHALRATGRTQEAIATGRAALRARAGDLLGGEAAAGDGSSVLSAPETGSLVADLVRWCHELDQPDLAVEVLEQGRALVLHATTSTASVAELLQDAGRPDLVAQIPAGGLSAARRQEVRAALMDSLAGQKLAMAPDPGEIGAALWAAQLDALVYLVPPSGNGGPALGVVVRPGGAVSWLPLPSCTDLTVMERYLDAYRDAFSPGADRHAVTRWQQRLEQVCDWAGHAVAEPLLRLARGWELDRVARVALIPVGSFAAVPWAAARRARPGQVHHVLEKLVLSSAASARLLIDASHRPRLTAADGVALVVNPEGNLPLSARAAAAVRESLYPDASCYGRPRRLLPDGPGTADQLLAVLPAHDRSGAGLLQVSAHARLGEVAQESRIALAPGSSLRVSDILDQARGRPAAAAGGVVVCDCCATDVTREEPDEALTLATAFLAAGAVGVVGTRWPVQDGVAAVVTYVLHERLAAGRTVPEALRETQLWMRDPSRQAPPGMPPLLADLATDPELAQEWAWAAYSAHGR